jgi:hypothetical protein
MSEVEKPQGAGVGRIILIVAAVLLLLALLCCGGCWVMGGKYVWKAGMPQWAMSQEVAAKHGEGTVVLTLPEPRSDDPNRMDFVLTVQVQGELTPDRVRTLQDDAWRAYVNAFADGGLGVKRIAVAQSGVPTPDWKGNSVPADEVAARTGLPAPPDADWLDEMKKSKVKIKTDVQTTPRSGDDRDDDDSGDDDGGDDGAKEPAEDPAK